MVPSIKARGHWRFGIPVVSFIVPTAASNEEDGVQINLLSLNSVKSMSEILTRQPALLQTFTIIAPEARTRQWLFHHHFPP